MNVSPPNVNLERIEEADLKLQLQLSPRWLSSGVWLEQLAGDMCSSPLQDTLNQIRQIKITSAEDCPSGDDLQKSEVSSSNPASHLHSDLIAPFLLHALDGFLFVVNTDGKIEFISQNVESFLKYPHESLIDNSIYNIIHVGDHARFSSNLLPMSIGNGGFGWPEGREKSSAFQCRFLVQPQGGESMEEKQRRVSTYEHMHVSAVLLPPPPSPSPTPHDTTQEVQNRLVCVARRVSTVDKNNSAPVAEQFLTRLDSRGKITSLDTANLSAANLKYLNKDLVGCIIQEICHPEDFQKLTQHLKDTLQQGSNTSGIYRLRFSNEKIIFVQTRSKRSNYNPMASEHEVIVATHTIISPDPPCLESPSAASGGGMNGAWAPLSPNDFSLNDLDFLPSSSWEQQPLPSPFSQGSPAPSKDNNNPLVPSPLNNSGNSGTTTPHQLLNNSGVPSPHPLNNNGNSVTTVSHLLNSGTTLNNNNNGGTMTLNSGGTSLHSLNNSVPANIHQMNNNGGSGGAMTLNSVATNIHQMNNNSGGATNPSPLGNSLSEAQLSGGEAQKLRNLLTHGGGGDSEAQLSKDIKMEGVVENGFNNGGADHHGNENLILRELLNQEDEEEKDGLAEICGDSLQKRALNNNNNMLRKVSLDLNSLPKSGSGPSRLASPAMDTVATAAKRKSPDTPMEESMAKRPAPQQNQPHAHLAGQNPMLASMLAQTPRSAPSVPTSVASAIVSQLPQERLPKNLEKKLVHTPSSYPQPPPHYSPQGGRDVVTADARGHVTLGPHHANFGSQVGNFMRGEPSLGGSQQLYGGGGMSSSAASLLIDGLAEASRDPNNVVSASDPLLSDILDQVWSMEQDMNMATDDLAFFKLLEELPDPHRPPPPPQDPNEKAAIQSIQKQLMSFQPPPQQQPQQQFQPPAYNTRPPPQQPQQMQPQQQRPMLPQYGGNNFNDLTPPMRRQLLEQHKHKVFLQQQFNQKKQLLQMQQQQKQQLQSPSGGPFGDGDLLSNANVAPNVTLQRSASMPEPQLSPRYSQPPSIPGGQLSPGQRTFSPMGGQYPPYPQQQARPPAWAQQRAAQQQQANLQQQNPMLNAQLSQQQFAGAVAQGQSRGFSPGPPRQMLPSPRHSPYPPDFHPPPPSPFQQQQRMQRAVSIPNRVNSPRGLGFSDPLLSPQPSPGGYGSPPVSNYASGNNYPQLDFPPYDQQQQQQYNPNMMDRSRGNGGGAIRSEYVRQELRAKVGARTQQHQMQQLVQQQQQQMPVSGSQSASQSISQADFDALGFALDMQANDVQPGSPALYSQSLMNSVGGTVNSNDPQQRTGSPRFQLEERPAEQKKSLLQQLLSEPP